MNFKAEKGAIPHDKMKAGKELNKAHTKENVGKVENFLNAGPLRESNDLLGMIKIQLSIAEKAQAVNEIGTIGS